MPRTQQDAAVHSARSRRPRRGPRRVLRCARRPGEATRHRLFVFAASPAALASALSSAHFMRAAVSTAGRCAVAGGVAELQGGQLRGRQPGTLLLPQRRAPGAGAGVVQHLRGVPDARGAAGEAGRGADGAPGARRFALQVAVLRFAACFPGWVWVVIWVRWAGGWRTRRSASCGC